MKRKKPSQNYVNLENLNFKFDYQCTGTMNKTTNTSNF